MRPEIRVRFAPSPTGYLHVGGARTALFNWLFARHHNGKFILRIEDTDVARSSDEMVEGILRGMRWLGLSWDEGPYFQSQRIGQYQTFARNLLEKNLAYRCFCSAEDLAARKNIQKTQTQTWHYDRRCMALSQKDAEAMAAAGKPFAVRFRVPEGSTSFYDHVFGDIEVENAQIEDFVLLRSDGIPTYHLSVVVDDLEMNITHVIRGADHISNTPKQVLLYQASGQAMPDFAHLPLILGSDKQRLSKRHGATSVMSYAEMGYLPDAFFNFLSLLGWSPGNDREIISRVELAKLFSLEGVGRANAVFGLEKLDWFNSQYIGAASVSELRELAVEELKGKQMWDANFARLTSDCLDPILTLLKSRIRKTSDFSTTFRAFFTDDFKYDPVAAGKFLADPRLMELISTLVERYEADSQFELDVNERKLRQLAEVAGVKAGLLINALRVGLTGQGVAPGLFEVMQVLGREQTISRMKRLVRYLSSQETGRE